MKRAGHRPTRNKVPPLRHANQTSRSRSSRGLSGAELRRAYDEMHDSESRLQLMADSLPVLISYVDAQERYRFNNAEYERWFGQPRTAYLGRSVREVVGRQAYAQLQGEISAALAGHPRSFEMQVPYKDAGLRDVQVDYVPHRNADQEVVGFFALIRDITERKKAEEAIRRSEANLAKAQEIANMGSYEYSAVASEEALWSKQIYRVLGLRSHKGISPHEYIHRLVHQDDREIVMRARQGALHQGLPFNIEYRVRLPGGGMRYVQSIGEPVVDESGKVVKIVGSLIDISERKRLEKEILETSEMEQRRIAQDLHDGLSQVLSGTRHLASILERNLEARGLAERKDAARIVALLAEAAEEARSIARGLYPVKAGPNGLMLGLEELVARTRELFSVACQFHCPTPVYLHDRAAPTHLYRIAQEAITNAIRHGKAHQIRIALRRKRDCIELSVRDDGLGIRERRRAEGMGIRIMRYRAGTIGAIIDIRRRQPRGTEVVCKLLRPVRPPQPAVTS